MMRMALRAASSMTPWACKRETTEVNELLTPSMSAMSLLL